MKSISTNVDLLAGDPITETVSAIGAKREGESLSDASIRLTVSSFKNGELPDYLMAAWLATVACSDLDLDETVSLTSAYIDSGSRLKLPPDLRPVVDKHSTGGVGDKTTLIAAPIVAACGVKVCKISGAGLGFAGGTLDKLESIPGMRMNHSKLEVLSLLQANNIVVTGQSEDLVPADAATYALRDVTATVRSIPLIAASIMSKKIATGSDGVVLDVKYGPGGLVSDKSTAASLGQLMVDIGEAFGLRCKFILSPMSEPLGYAIGNAVEVSEALHVLSGGDRGHLFAVCLDIAARMLQCADPHLTDGEALATARAAVDSGAALDSFVNWIAGQGGDLSQITPFTELHTKSGAFRVRATRSGHLKSIDARTLGSLACALGAGRRVYGDSIDAHAGIVLNVQSRDSVKEGDLLLSAHSSRRIDSQLEAALIAAFELE